MARNKNFTVQRSFNIGRQSEQLYNEELYKVFESIRHLLDIPEDKLTPDAKLHGSLWLDLSTGELKYYNSKLDTWELIFKNKFRIVDSIMSTLPPEPPVIGQLWINQGILMYYDGAKWHPIRALLGDESELNLAVFENFIILSPALQKGNLVVNEDDPVEKSQFLVPNIKTGKYFLHREYKTDFETVNNVTIQYPKKALANKRPSWVHINPGKLTSIKKRLFKIDRYDLYFDVSAHNTEFYGFRKGEPFGHLLLPSEDGEGGDYYPVDEGISLTYNAAQSFDYLLAIRYDFGWIKASGKLNRLNTKEPTTSYYVGGLGGPINVFIEGYDLENKYYYYDNMLKVLKIKDPNMTPELEMQILRSIYREYGIIGEENLNKQGIIRMRKKYNNPLLFVNGQALHHSLGDFVIQNDLILVPGAKRDMSYCIMELKVTDSPNPDRNYNMFIQSGQVTQEQNGKGVIQVKRLNEIAPEEGIILFVDGLLVKKEEVERNYLTGTITAPGLKAGQEYILLYDKFNDLIPEEEAFKNAIVTGKLDEAVVYLDEYLISDDRPVITSNSMEKEKNFAANREIKVFLSSEEDYLEKQYKIFSSYEEGWVDLDESDIQAINTLTSGYTYSLNCIFPNEALMRDGTVLDVFAYNFANTIEKPLIINSIEANGETYFPIEQHFVPGTNSLSVFVNGVRQYPSAVTEFVDGSGFHLAEPVTGRVTYIIQHPEDGQQMSAMWEELDHEDVLAGSSNVYKTELSLYPGRVTIYINGIRQPKEAFTILDNHTLMINDQSVKLITDTDQVPVQKKNGSIAYVDYQDSDKILVEVRQDYERQEKTIKTTGMVHEIDTTEHDLPFEILESTDEILIFVNGLFTGLKDGIGYQKNRGKGVITILERDVFFDRIGIDPLYNYFQIYPLKHELYRQEYGKDYEPKLDAKITLEWR